jgi:DNA-binding GntR family transcriptional regulator
VARIVDDSAHNMTTASDTDAYVTLGAEISSGRLSPNERLVEADLVDRYGLSRAAIRIALVRLEQDRVVVREPHRGARVRLVSESEAVEILETRAALQGIAAAYAAQRASDHEIAEMGRIADQMVALQAAGDLLAMSEANGELHRLILESSHHETVQRLAAGLKSQMVRFQYRTILAAGRSSHSLAEHRAIVAAIAAREAEGAERAMGTHLGNVARALHERARSETATTTTVAAG